jgi:hypothetical protein
MKTQIRRLQAEIESDLEAIAEVYRLFDKATTQLGHEPERGIVIGYYLHVLYGLFESLLQRVTFLFGNEIGDGARWHAELLHRMTLEIKEIRPPVLSRRTYECLDELRKFRHLFRNAYLFQFDPRRLDIVIEEARTLRPLYRVDLRRFLAFLDTLATLPEGDEESL